MNLPLKVKSLLLLLFLFIFGCKEENNFSPENFYNLKIMDPYDSYSSENDTIYYLFQTNGQMTKIRHQYSFQNEEKKLVSKDTIRCVYILDKDILHMHLHESEYDKYLPIFGKDDTQWEILKLNSDTMIVNLYSQEKKVGHCGFKVLN